MSTYQVAARAGADTGVAADIGAVVAGFVLSGPAGSSRGEGRETLLGELTRTGLDWS